MFCIKNRQSDSGAVLEEFLGGVRLLLEKDSSRTMVSTPARGFWGLGCASRRFLFNSRFLEQKCQTQIHCGPKLCSEVKPRARFNIY